MGGRGQGNFFYLFSFSAAFRLVAFTAGAGGRVVGNKLIILPGSVVVAAEAACSWMKRGQKEAITVHMIYIYI